ncbi:unnamed protein product [marine sediment metagenome]|uniref:Uncharacterized protein n=1 Tax=marine sediment metagenome TaxID=412755 RepID=X0S806_9ZZZZ
MNKYAMQFIYTVLAGVVLAGLAWGMDGRIDQRISIAIDEFDVRQINRKIEFYITKEQLAPQSVTADDRVNKAVLERQLQQLRHNRGVTHE